MAYYSAGFIFLLFVFAGSIINLHATPQAEQTSTNNRKRSKKKKSQEASSEQATGSSVSKLDLNTASKQELSALAGIGDAYAQKIVDGRPYKSKSDLVEKGIIPSSVYDKIKPDVTARRTAAMVASRRLPRAQAA